MMAMAQTRDQTILEVGVMQETVALGQFFAEDYRCGDVWISYRCGAASAGKSEDACVTSAGTLGRLSEPPLQFAMKLTE
jgi:hypothetical protein